MRLWSNFAITRMTVLEPIKGFIVFSCLIIFIAWGTVMLYPAFEDMMLEQGPTSVGTDIMAVSLDDSTNGTYTVTWAPINQTIPFIPPGVIKNYSIRESNTTDIANGTVVYLGNGTSVTLTNRTDGPFYYGLYLHFDDPFSGGEIAYPIMNISTEDLDGKSPFAEMMENPFYEAFTGQVSDDIAPFTLKWFILIEFFSYMSLVISMYIAYLASGLVSKDVENKTADLLLSTPLPRWKYLLEKFMAITILSFLMTVMVFAGIYLGVLTIGDETVTAQEAFATALAGFPLMLAFSALAMIFSLLLDEQKKAMGSSFAVIFLMYAFYMGSQITDSLEGLKKYLLFDYVDVGHAMASGSVAGSDAGVLLIFSIIVLVVALLFFQRKEIYI